MTDQTSERSAGPPQGRDRGIVRAAIHPAIGVARIGNSPDEFFLAPEIPDPPPEPPGAYRDRDGALKRQAARFRIYGYDAAGRVVREITADDADIRWTVHLANAKAAWYRFELALDIPEAASAPPSELRNKDVADRATLVIDPGPRSIRGPRQSGAVFDSGTFLGTPVYLGELRTDEAGRLIVLGGRGVSASADGSPARDFANNDGWHDDVSDGPVTAEVEVGGRRIPVEPAWVVVAPPNYAPNLVGVRTMYDLMTDTFVRTGALPLPDSVSFADDVLPLLRRLIGLQWVNAGFAAQFGWGAPNHFLSPDYLARLADTTSAHRELRRQIANAFRRFDRDGASPVPWPWLYGDAMNVPPAPTPRQHVALTETQLHNLDLWADGKFASAPPVAAEAPRGLDDVPLAERPARLDRAALDFCLADAFHPGCEMTWPMRHPTVYTAPYRIRHRAAGAVEPNYGSRLTPETALSPDGPLHAQGPGGLTRWMALPWQTDTASCRSAYYAGYGPRYDPYLPTFWPARVPNQVLTEADYAKAVDPKLPRQERLAAFAGRASWFRTLGPGDYIAQINAMVASFGRMGIVEVRPGVPDDPDLPPEMQVEALPAAAGAPPLTGLMVVAARSDRAADLAAAASVADAMGLPEDAAVTGVITKVHRFPAGLKPR